MSYFVHKAYIHCLFLVQTTAYLRYFEAEVDLSVVGSTFKQSWCQHLFMRWTRYYHRNFAILQISTTSYQPNGTEVAAAWSLWTAIFGFCKTSTAVTSQHLRRGIRLNALEHYAR